MNRKGAVILPILIGLVLIFLALTAVSFYSYQQEHGKNIRLQGQIDELNTRQRITNVQLNEAKKLAAEFQLKVQESKAKLETLTGELAQEKSVRLEVSNRFDQINADLKQQKALRQDLENKLNQSEADGKKIKDQLKVISQEKKDLEVKIKNLESGANGVELGKVVVNSDQEPVVLASSTAVGGVASGSKILPVQQAGTVLQPVDKSAKLEKKVEAPQGKSLEGKIVVVNKEYNFAVINLGSKDGVSLQDEFYVTRSGKVIGNLKVEKVHESMSAAGFDPESKDNIKENDVVQKAR